MESYDRSVVSGLQRFHLDLRYWIRACENGWKNPALDQLFGSDFKLQQHQHQQQQHPPKFKKSAQELFRYFNLQKKIDSRGTLPFQFLDIGFAPGGITCELLRRFPQCTGYGITLGDARPCDEIKQYTREKRFKYWYLDAEKIKSVNDFPEEIRNQTFELIIDDICPMFGVGSNFQKDEIQTKRRKYCETMTKICLTILNPGGMLIRRERLEADIWTKNHLERLKKSFDHLFGAKPFGFFCISRTYYLLCEGFSGKYRRCNRNEAYFFRYMANLWKPLIRMHYHALTRANANFNFKRNEHATTRNHFLQDKRQINNIYEILPKFDPKRVE
jgi:23S rRNA U2552 (ribose-2'-O)-methylase RlmE/FtsJ